MFTLDPSTIPPVFQNTTELALLLEPKDPPFIAAMKKVVPTDLGKNTVLTVYLSKCESTYESGTFCAICIMKTMSTQVVIDCVLSDDYTPLTPIWYAEQCEKMIEKYRMLLQTEITLLVTQTLAAHTE